MVEHFELNRAVAFFGAMPAREAFALGRDRRGAEPRRIPALSRHGGDRRRQDRHRHRCRRHERNLRALERPTDPARRPAGAGAGHGRSPAPRPRRSRRRTRGAGAQCRDPFQRRGHGGQRASTPIARASRARAARRRPRQRALLEALPGTLHDRNRPRRAARGAPPPDLRLRQAGQWFLLADRRQRLGGVLRAVAL